MSCYCLSAASSSTKLLRCSPSESFTSVIYQHCPSLQRSHGESRGSGWVMLRYLQPLHFARSASDSLVQVDMSQCVFKSSGEVVLNATGSSRDRARASSNSSHSSNSLPPRDPSLCFPDVKRIFISIFAFLFANSLATRAAYGLAENSIGASSLGLKVASFLRGSGLPDELVVVTIAAIPVLELRGAIPVSYWLQLEPAKGYALAVLGNMIPVPFIFLYLEKLSNCLAARSRTAKKFVQWLFNNTRIKAEPIREFEWLGLMLFVAVPFPGTGAWSGAIAASVLGMPFWEAMSANFVGVLIAGCLVNILVSVGVKLALIIGLVLFLLSTFMWNLLKVARRKF